MREVLVRAALLGVAFGSAVVGVWATLAPRSFYDDFPGGGQLWVAPDGPYNEHLVRDVGGLNLALALVLVVAAVTLAPLLVRTATAAYLLYAVPHLAYHLRNLDVYDTAEKVGSAVSLSLAVVVPLAVLVDSLRARHSASISSGMRR
jgi:hypothetical protein